MLWAALSRKKISRSHMGVIALLIALSLIAFGFIRAAMALIRYRKQLYDQEINVNLTYKEKHPRWYVYLRFSLPVIIVFFYFSAMSAIFGFIYVVARWLSA